MNAEKMVLVHDWEKRGFRAPYTLLGIWSAPSKGLLEQNPSAYNNEMAARPKCCHFVCDVCGTPIANHFIVRDAAGKNFAVGCDCIEKSGNTKLMTETKAAKLAADRAKRAEKRAQKAEADRIAREARIAEERARNGGLTDWEAEQKRKQAERLDRYASAVLNNERLFRALSQSDFGNDIFNQFAESGRFPQNRALNICADIFAKFHGGRKNSKEYNAALDEFFGLYQEG